MSNKFTYFWLTKFATISRPPHMIKHYAFLVTLNFYRTLLSNVYRCS